MKYLLLIVCISTGTFASGQAIENIEFVKLELYGGRVISNSILTGGEDLQLFYSEKHDEVISKTLFPKYPDQIYYPIIARFRLYKKMQLFPDNLSFDVNFEYLKKVNGVERAFKITSFIEVHHHKILGRDSTDENKFFSEAGNKIPSELILSHNIISNTYRLDYLDKANSVVQLNLFIDNLTEKIREGVTL